MNLPNQHQIAVVGTHVATASAAVIATLGFAHVISPADVNNAGQAISQISDGLGKVMAGVGTLFGIASGVYAFINSSPLTSFLRSSKTVAASPALTEQVKVATLADKAPLVAITDKLPEVVGVGTTRTQAGQDLAAAVPSMTVQTVTTPASIGAVSGMKAV
jgi:hypothetical protein